MAKKLTAAQAKALLATLQTRFEKHPERHRGIAWADVQKALNVDTESLWSLHEMERTGGEPDVVGRDTMTGEMMFFDCSPESPSGRRSLCYDKAARDARKEAKPADSATNMAEVMGVELLDESQYRHLQTLGEFDLKTSSWITTPEAIRELGGALFGDRRYDHVFMYHNGAQSYYAARGFRGVIRIG